MKPICVPCERFMRMKKSGYYFTEGMPTKGYNGQGKNATGWIPYKIWVGDLYECPDCKTQVISGVGFDRLAEHYESDFKDVMKNTHADQLLVKDC